MIEDYFNLQRAPFKLGTDPYFYYDSESHRKAMAYLQYGLQQAEGFVVVTGDAGVGKSMLVEQLKQRIEEQNVVLALLQTGYIQRGEVIDHVLAAFHVEPQGNTTVAKVNALQTFLSDQYVDGKQAILIIDEAQQLSTETLEEIRVLTNVSSEGAPLLQIFLVGQSSLKEKLATPEMEQFRQRIIASCHLGALDEEETAAYIDHRLFAAGWGEEESAFTDVAHAQIYAYTKGIPRKINKLCARLLLQAALDNKDHVDGAIVSKVVDELKAESLQVAEELQPGVQEPVEVAEEPLADIEADAANTNVVPFAPAANEEEWQEALQPLEEVVLDDLDSVDEAHAVADDTDSFIETDGQKTAEALEAQKLSRDVEVPHMTGTDEKAVTPDLSGIDSVLDRLGAKRRQKAEAPSAPVEPVLPTETPDLELPEDFLPEDEEPSPAAASLEEIAEQISANLEEDTALDTDEEISIEPVIEEVEEEELPIITSIEAGNTPELADVKEDIASFVAELRESLMVARQRVDVVRDRVEDVEAHRKKRNELIAEKLQKIDDLLRELRGEK
jgi:type II secretory pathway predicted ATPase ExeA